MTRSVAVAGATTGPNAVNKATWRHESDPFGTSLGTSASNENPQNITGTQTQIKAGSMRLDNAFPGQLRDRESGKSYNYFRDYDSAIGRYSKSDPVGLKAGLNTFGYAAQNPARNSDPLGLLTWKGSVNSYGLGPYSRDDYTLESECKCGHKAKVRVQAQAFAVGKGGTYATSNAEFEDSLSCPEPYVFDGPYFKVGAGISGGMGTTFSFVLMGGARSPGAWGAQAGLDLSAGVSVGKATVQEPIEWTQCDCGKK